MKLTFRTIAFAVGFWCCILFVGGIVAVLRGHCFDQQCINEKLWIAIATLASGAVIFIVVLAIVRPWKNESDSD